MPAAESKKQGVPISPLWPLLGWSVFGISVFTFAFGLMWGADLYVKQNTERRLTEEQKTILYINLKAQPDSFFRQVFVTSDPEAEATQFATAIYNHLKMNGSAMVFSLVLQFLCKIKEYLW
jgi:hypothetical protein